MLAYIFVLFAAAFRFAPHPFAFTPVAASLLFFGSRMPRKQAWIPVLLLAVGDVLLTRFVYSYPFTSYHLASWVWYAAMVFLGGALKKNANALRVLSASLVAAVSFFLVSNFAVWATVPNMYPRTWGGLELAYIAGLPFFRNDVAGDVFFTALMFGIPALLHAGSSARESSPQGPIAGA